MHKFLNERVMRRHLAEHHHPFGEHDAVLDAEVLRELHQRDHNTRAGLKTSHTHRPREFEQHGPVVRYPIPQEAVEAALAGERSEWYWFAMPNGDMAIGFYPQGDTYEQAWHGLTPTVNVDKGVVVNERE